MKLRRAGGLGLALIGLAVLGGLEVAAHAPWGEDALFELGIPGSLVVEALAMCLIFIGAAVAIGDREARAEQQAPVVDQARARRAHLYLIPGGRS